MEELLGLAKFGGFCFAAAFIVILFQEGLEGLSDRMENLFSKNRK